MVNPFDYKRMFTAMPNWHFGREPDGSYYGVILSDTRWGDQDDPHNFPTREDAHRYGQANARKWGFSTYILYHTDGKGNIEWKTRHYVR